jgi:hypothetical protein
MQVKAKLISEKIAMFHQFWKKSAIIEEKKKRREKIPLRLRTVDAIR